MEKRSIGQWAMVIGHAVGAIAVMIVGRLAWQDGRWLLALIAWGGSVGNVMMSLLWLTGEMEDDADE